jgi:ppGpp synthetase/RelA/SpoT-type nucleotidyltranferase
MAWAKPQYSRTEVNAAGDTLIAESAKDVPLETILERVEELHHALKVINNWRSSHSYPLHCLKMALRTRAKRVSRDAIVAQRIKRLSSIEAKLRRWEGMQLARMHDIGGCRAIMRNVQQVNELVRVYEESRAKNRRRGPEFVRPYDYIAEPKEDGYRSIHLVYKFRSSSRKYRVYNGLRIEIQLRTQLQHAWATAVETASMFTGQALKSNVGDESWKRFFALASTALAIREKLPTVPGTPTGDGLVIELRELYNTLQVHTVLQGWGAAAQQLTGARHAHTYLLVLDTRAKMIQVTGFQETELPKAAEAYLVAEKSALDKPERQTVLVSVDTLAGLRRAYPNFFLDTAAFIEAVQQAIGDSGSR